MGKSATSAQSFRRSSLRSRPATARKAWSQANSPTHRVAAAARACSALTQQTGAVLGEPTARVLTAKRNPRSELKADPAAPPWMGPAGYRARQHPGQGGSHVAAAGPHPTPVSVSADRALPIRRYEPGDQFRL
jgi:hypothetical protein